MGNLDACRRFFDRRFGSRSRSARRSVRCAEPPREYVDAQGNTVREFRDTTKRTVWETKEVDQVRTVMEPKIQTDYQTQVRQVQVPIVENVLVPELVNRWNPFATPHYEYRQQQRTRYELRQETVQTPIVKQEWVTKQQTVKVPQLVQREVEEEIIRKVVVRDLPAANLNASDQRLVQLPTNGQRAPAGTIPLGGPTSDPFAQAPGSTVARRDPRFAAQPPVTTLPGNSPAPPAQTYSVQTPAAQPRATNALPAAQPTAPSVATGLPQPRATTPGFVAPTPAATPAPVAAPSARGGRYQ
ncbi:MAG: hypothetical protein QM811_29520 [Pirellulales bacterium]